MHTGHRAGMTRKRHVRRRTPTFLAFTVQLPVAANAGIPADTALRVGRYFGASPQFWMNFSAPDDRKTRRASLGNHLGTVHLLQAASAHRHTGADALAMVTAAPIS